MRTMADFSSWMDLALAQARQASASADVPVGAVIVHSSGTVLGSGRNRREADADPTAHAEILALRAAAAAVGSWHLEGCTLVVTLEPCPMCAGAALAARVDRIVFAAWDPKAGAAGSVWDLPRDRNSLHRCEVVAGVREAESAALLRSFFAPKRNEPPTPPPTETWECSTS